MATTLGLPIRTSPIMFGSPSMTLRLVVFVSNISALLLVQLVMDPIANSVRMSCALPGTEGLANYGAGNVNIYFLSLCCSC